MVWTQGWWTETTNVRLAVLLQGCYKPTSERSWYALAMSPAELSPPELAAGLEWERPRDWVCLAKVLKVTL